MTRLSGGSLELYAGSRPRLPDTNTLPNTLVRLQLEAPALIPSDAAQASIPGPLVAEIIATGDVGWARLLRADGTIEADLVVKAENADDASIADVLVSRTDLQRGGICTITVLTVSLPR